LIDETQAVEAGAGHAQRAGGKRLGGIDAGIYNRRYGGKFGEFGCRQAVQIIDEPGGGLVDGGELAYVHSVTDKIT
jgi:hypothetical protein